MAKKTETQAEKNARIQKELGARGAKFQTKEQITAQRERAGKKQAQLAKQPAARGNGAAARGAAAMGGNGRTARDPREYGSGKVFDEVQRKAMRKAGAD